MKTLTSFLTVLIILTGISGCENSLPVVSPGGSYSGTLSGLVSLIDSNGFKIWNQSGVTVSIEGTSLATVSDSSGRWNIDGIATGIYTIDFTKPGFGYYKDMNQGFIGGDTGYISTVTLTQPPNFTVSIDSAKTITDSNSIYISGYAHGCHGIGFSRVMIAIGTSPDVSASDANKYVYTTTTVVWSNNVFIGDHIYKPDLNLAGFSGGSTVYVVMYPFSSNTGSAFTKYLDVRSGKYVYTSLGAPSAILPVKIPL